MKTIIFMVTIALVAANFDYYNLEKLDINDIINNIDELQRLFDCVMELGDCSKLYSPYRAITAEVIKQACKRCSPDQKHDYWLFLQAIKRNFPANYANYWRKYDRENKYFDALNSELIPYSNTI